MRGLAQVISVVFHPLWMPIATYLVILALDPFIYVHQSVFSFLLFILIINTLAPGISVAIMVKRKMVTSLEIKNRKERLAPFILVLLYYILAYILIRVKGIQVPEEIMSLLSALIFSLLVAMLVSLRMKISVHLMAQGAIAGVLIALSIKHNLGLSAAVSLAVLIAALVAWARLKLEVHSLKEVYAGYLTGAIIQFVFLFYGLCW
jgi:hypothetical protein